LSLPVSLLLYGRRRLSLSGNWIIFAIIEAQPFRAQTESGATLPPNKHPAIAERPSACLLNASRSDLSES